MSRRPSGWSRTNDGDEREAAEYLEIPLGLVQAAVAYYGAYRDEIDEWIELNARESEAAHQAWLAGTEPSSVKLLLDEMFSPLVAAELRARGPRRRRGQGARRVAVAPRSRGRRARADEQRGRRYGQPPRLPPAARRARRTGGGEGHAGMSSLPRSFRPTRAATGQIVEALEARLAEYPGDADLANGEDLDLNRADRLELTGDHGAVRAGEQPIERGVNVLARDALLHLRADLERRLRVRRGRPGPSRTEAVRQPRASG